eukprot:CAMPEP_0197451936 /NCGR_PEP_ID=MMETSP1175-20131217/30601_1 /TAXON_ID=1003142 /ORGANISM="Triceratium dubium, Strain CCMP147" /LENGTH=168 /DNA_ID=CAMNT_0042984813 /DNA_START=150 /DNA_END=656 /DNA_ORIENTATION=+
MSESKAADGEMVILVSNDGEKFPVEKRVAQMSELVTTVTEDEGSNDPIPLPDVKSSVLQKVLEFCKHHVDSPMPTIEKPLKSAELSECGVPDWDTKFVQVDQELLFELILAANYLDIKPLLDLSCAKVASMIKGKTPEEIRKTFNIVNDFTPEEEAQVREENKWCEET